MVILNKIYTKTGDDGTTGLGNGERRIKCDPRVEAYGTVDEAGAVIGLVRLHCQDTDLDKLLSRIQNDLFDLGADLAVPDDPENPPEFPPLRITGAQVKAIEVAIDIHNSELQTLRSFVLAGGNALSAHLHLARTVIRRAERGMVDLAKVQGERVNPHAIQYANRLSDLFFVLARYANDKGKADVLWQPGENRE